MTWNWLAWKRAYQIAAVEPNTLWMLRPKDIRARALQRPRTPRTVHADQVSNHPSIEPVHRRKRKQKDEVD